MENATHTPGPWEEASQELEGTDDIGLHVVCNDEVVCSFFEHTGACLENYPNDKANARLIAAAPDMLDALLNVQKLISEAAMTGFNWKDGDWADRLFFSQQKTSAAIRKATGAA